MVMFVSSTGATVVACAEPVPVQPTISTILVVGVISVMVSEGGGSFKLVLEEIDMLVENLDLADELFNGGGLGVDGAGLLHIGYWL